MARIALDAQPTRQTFELVAAGLAELHRRGLKSPSLLVFGILDNARAIARYDDTYDCLMINVSNEFWRDPTGTMSGLAASRFVVSDDPRATIYHEVGHALHRRRYRLGFRWLIESSARLSEHERRIAQRVSQYACENAGEFVVEVFAGLVAGRIFDGEVMALYQKLRGPAL